MTSNAVPRIWFVLSAAGSLLLGLWLLLLLLTGLLLNNTMKRLPGAVHVDVGLAIAGICTVLCLALAGSLLFARRLPVEATHREERITRFQDWLEVYMCVGGVVGVATGIVYARWWAGPTDPELLVYVSAGVFVCSVMTTVSCHLVTKR